MASQSDVLELVASIKDNFTPGIQKMIRELRTFTGYSQQTHKEGTILAQKHGMAFNDLRKAVQSTSDTIKGVLTPAMAGLGVGTLSAGVAVAGLTSGVKSLAESWRNVKFVASEAGVSPDVIRTYENAGRFIGQTAAAMDGMVRSASLIQLEMKKGFGTGADFFRGMGRGMQDARIRINQATDAQDYLNRVIEEGARITDTRLRRSFFEAMTGMPELSRLTAENLKTAQQYLASLSGQQKKDLTALQESFDLLGLSTQSFKESIEADLAPAILGLSERVRAWLDGPAREYVAAAKTWVEQNPELVKAIGLVSIAIGGLAIAGGALSLTFGAIGLALSPLTLAFSGIVAAITLAYEAYRKFSGAKLPQLTAPGPGQSAAGMMWGNLKKALGFAEGGVVTSPVHALLGESGPEAVIPLDRFGGKEKSATEVTVRAMLQAVLRLEEIWRRFTGFGQGQRAGGGIGGATPGGGGGGGTPGAGGGGGAPGGGAGGGQPGVGEYNVKKAYDLIKAAGGTDEEARNLAAISQAESKGNPRAFNPRGRDLSYGLWQINMLGAMGPARRAKYGLKSNEDLYDPATNARVALAMSREGRGYRDWSTYLSGDYRKYLSGAVPGDGGRATPAADNSATQGRAHNISGRISDIGGVLPAGQTVPGLKELETATAGIPGGRRRISSENDLFHHGLSYHSKHVEGLAFDQTLINASRHASAAEFVRNKIRSAGLTDKDFRVIDEYAHPSRAATGGHIHSQFSTAEAAARFKAAMGGKDMTYGPQLPAKGAGMEYGPQLPGHTPVVDTNAVKGRATPAEAVAGGVGGGAGGGGGGGACNCAGAMSASASGLGGIVGMLFGQGGAQNMLSSMMGAVSGHAKGGGLLGGLLGGGGGPMGFLGGTLGRTMAGAMSHKIEGAANLDINLKGFPKGTNTAASFEGLFKKMNISRQPTMPLAQSY